MVVPQRPREADIEKIVAATGRRDIAIHLPTTLEDIAELFADVRLAFVLKAHTGYFALANRTPVGMLSYDMKCQALLEMFVDHPQRYAVGIDRLVRDTAADEVNRILQNLRTDSTYIRKSQGQLLTFLDAEYDLFCQRMFDLIAR